MRSIGWGVSGAALSAALFIGGCGARGGSEASAPPGPALGSDESELSSSCTGLLPAATGAGLTRVTASGSNGICAAGTSDAAGDIGLFFYEQSLSTDVGVQLVDPTTGANRGGFGAGAITGGRFGGPGELFDFFPQHTGFDAINHPVQDDTVQSYSGSGQLVRTSPSSGAGAGGLDYGGGFVALSGVKRADGTCCQPGMLQVQRFDSTAAPRTAPVAVDLHLRNPSGFYYSIGSVSLSGLSFVGAVEPVTATSSQLDFVWLDRSGNVLAHGHFAMPTPASFGALGRPLLDGSIAIQVDGVWAADVKNGSATATAAPSWLAARPGWDLELRPGSKGYALIEPGGKTRTDCAQNVELHAPAGNNCGTLRFRTPAPICQSGVQTGLMMMGRDGTIVRSLVTNTSVCNTTTGGCCAYHFWPHVLN